MAGAEDKVGVINDWGFPNPSPRTFMSNFLSEDFGSRSLSDSFQGNEGLPRAFQMDSVDRVYEASKYLSFEPNWSGAHNPNMHGNLAERMAANGFNVPKLNTARIPPTNLSSSTDVRSPYLTIPPGLSPTSLLDSPVFLSNYMAQSSPTTGKLQILLDNSTQPTLHVASEAPYKSDDCIEGASGFSFKPPFDTFYPCTKIVASDVSQQQTLSDIGICFELEKAKEIGTPEIGTMNFQNEEFSFQAESKQSASANTSNQRSDSCMGSTHSGPFDDQQDGDMDLKEEFSSVAVPAPAEDGYNWRKYGHKQVKVSEFPRSYYKCTQPNCQVKKKVERSQEGQITEIIYKGSHNHSKPPPTRRTAALSSHPFGDTQMDGPEQPDLQAGGSDSQPIWANTNIRNESHDRQGDALEFASPALVLAECRDSSTTVQHAPDEPHLSSDVVDVSSTLSNDKDDGDQVTHGSASVCCEGEGDETDSKRMKLDTNAIEMNAASRAVREPRVVVQTTSEVDILDDGYRWRKYGQKVVKGNPNPSYYKCTHPGCNVRKHVERAAHDLKSVITTYEGKHNHEVPAARNSGHGNSATSIAAPQSQGTLPRPDSAQASLTRYECPPLNPAFALSGAQQLRPTTSFAFGMVKPGLTMTGLGSMHTMSSPVLPAVHSYLGHHRALEGGFAKAGPKVEAIPESTLTTSNGALICQMMNGTPARPPI
ncbi:putative WRKY transcription factor 2 isoform X2 [Curcuma longa]|uniref:putative WRKY transcription factor 2 isoform X2 n=1 Tax=Curcuma longa TaxID=136217 RepID=UPI003D9E092B